MPLVVGSTPTSPLEINLGQGLLRWQFLVYMSCPSSCRVSYDGCNSHTRRFVGEAVFSWHGQNYYLVCSGDLLQWFPILVAFGSFVISNKATRLIAVPRMTSNSRICGDDWCSKGQRLAAVVVGASPTLRSFRKFKIYYE